MSLLALLVVCPVSVRAQDYIWIEAESPIRSNVKFEAGGWGRDDYLSGKKWLFANIEPKDLDAKLPKEGAILSYEFKTDPPKSTTVKVRPVEYEDRSLGRK